MKIVLVSQVEKLGVRGEICQVKEGYGRNFLLPQGLAVLSGTQAAREILRERQEKREEKKQKQEEKLAREKAKAAKKIVKAKIAKTKKEKK